MTQICNTTLHFPTQKTQDLENQTFPLFKLCHISNSFKTVLIFGLKKVWVVLFKVFQIGTHRVMPHVKGLNILVIKFVLSVFVCTNWVETS